MDKPVEVQFELMSDNAHPPTKATPTSLGWDLYAALPPGEPIIIYPGDSATIPHGVRLCLPPGHDAEIRPRSGLAVKYGLTVLNAPGTVDEDYRGELRTILVNTNGRAERSAIIHRGMRVSQLIIRRSTPAVLVHVKHIDTDTGRGTDGFGSSGD